MPITAKSFIITNKGGKTITVLVIRGKAIKTGTRDGNDEAPGRVSLETINGERVNADGNGRYRVGRSDEIWMSDGTEEST